MKGKIRILAELSALLLVVSACGKTESADYNKSSAENQTNATLNTADKVNLSGVVPEELEYIPDDYDAVVKSRTPVYFAVGEKDEYYGSEPSQKAYDTLHELYEKEGLSDSEIDKLLVLDIRPTSYFAEKGITNQHAYGGSLFCKDESIMGWLFGQHMK